MSFFKSPQGKSLQEQANLNLNLTQLFPSLQKTMFRTYALTSIVKHYVSSILTCTSLIGEINFIYSKMWGQNSIVDGKNQETTGRQSFPQILWS